jgi:hypothetical protein
LSWSAFHEVTGNPKERSMTLRLVNCPRKDALALLNEVVRVYEQRVSPESRLRHLNAEVELLVRPQAVMQLQLAQLQVAGAVQGNVMVPVQVWGHVTPPAASTAAGPSLVLKPPRLIYNSR